MLIGIEEAADALSPEQKRELFLFLVARFRADGAEVPAPRRLSKETMSGWIAEDEADVERFGRGACCSLRGRMADHAGGNFGLPIGGGASGAVAGAGAAARYLNGLPHFAQSRKFPRLTSCQERRGG